MATLTARRAPATSDAGLRGAAIEQILDLVTHGMIDLDARTSENEIAERLGMSRTPVREAVAILVAEGFISQRPQVGLYIRSIPGDEALEVVRLRRGVDTAIVEEFSAKAFDLQPVWDSVSKAREALGQDALIHFLKLAADFHVQLAVAGGFLSGARSLRSWGDKLRVFDVRHPLSVAEATEIHVEHVALVSALGKGRTTDALTSIEREAAKAGSRIERAWTSSGREVPGPATLIAADVG
jgi:DNA-binding GntR family transcriptional regulator